MDMVKDRRFEKGLELLELVIIICSQKNIKYWAALTDAET